MSEEEWVKTAVIDDTIVAAVLLRLNQGWQPPVLVGDSPVDQKSAVHANGTNEITTTSKRSRRKKTLADLKEEEILLIKERKHLKSELALLRTNLENQRDTNQNLKKMKLDLQQKHKEVEAEESKFMLPDLNLPFDAQILCGAT
ncbi:hypothetical protein RND71_006149 [Anisodus tanguticus]|uniref:Uncharacterized protein n=1 Tax=Anisodus tanguticus TaxID=243964 RepID=A0AAE1VNC3_9SOLA|nr:hypothetical protein RND71_006149 [Anisodus tanguticus]